MVQLLQVAVSVIFFANKAFVLIDKKFGWLLGTIAAGLACWYFFLLNLYVYTALEIGLVILMGYGFLKKDQPNSKVEWLIRLSLLASMITIAVFAFQGRLTLIEFTSSVFMLFGTYLLTHAKEKWGWVLYSLAHLGAAYIGYAKIQNMFGDFQIASSIVCFAGVINSKKSRM